MSRVVRAALTETRNAFADMPQTVGELGGLAARLDEVREANVGHHVELIGAAAGHGARVIGLGELFHAPYFALQQDPMWHALAEDALEGPTIRTMRAAAQEHGVILVAPIYELDSGRRFNTAVVIDERGEVIGKYRKTHVPEGSNERGSFHETFYYERSNGDLGEWPANVSRNRYFPVFVTSVGRVAVATCYDRHFEGVVSTLASAGAEIVFSPAVTFGETSRRLWDLEFPVDAARHRLYIGGSNRRGAEPPWGVEYFGSSYFVGPSGRVEPTVEHPHLVIADLDLDGLGRAGSSGWDLRRDARTGIYGHEAP